MVDVVLIQPKAQKEGEVLYAPLGLLSLAAYLESEYEVVIVDQRLKNCKKTLSNLSSREPIAIGITAMTGGQIAYGLEIAKFVRAANPNIPMIWGGVHPSLLPKQTLENPYVDIVVKYEGEQTLFEVIEALERHKCLKGVQGITYKENGRIHDNPNREFLRMEKLPMPAWHLVDVKAYSADLAVGHGDRPINIHTSRGCPNRCFFCYNLRFNQRRWRSKSPSLVIGELQYLIDKFGINRIIIHDDNFAVNKKRALEISRQIKKEHLDVKWTIDMRVDQFDRNLLSGMKAAGLYCLRVGTESGSQRILNLIQKDIFTHQIVDSAKIARELGLDVLYSFVVGWPSETEEEREQTINLAFKLAVLHPKASFYPLWIYTPYPGTPLYDFSVSLGFKPPNTLEGWGNYHWDVTNIPWIENKKGLELMHFLSQAAFYNKGLKEIFNEFLSNKIGLKITVTRLGAFLMKDWAGLRFKHNFWSMPYEHLFLKKILGFIKNS